MKENSKVKKSFIIFTTSAALILGSFPPTFGTPTVVEAATHVQEGQIKSAVNFRTSPSLSSGRYGTIPSGATVKVLQEVNQHWLKVEYRGIEGYISSQQRFIEYRSGQAPRISPATSTGNQQINNQSSAKQSWEIKADQIIQDGLKLRGAPYRFGARAGTGYYDCSLFIQQVYRNNGISLPRNSRQQYNYVDKVSKSEIRKGDLVFFDTQRDGRIDHVAIYMGDNKLLHTYKVGIGVTVSTASGYWESRYVGAGRVIK